MTFQKGSGFELVAFVYADYVSKDTDRRSISCRAVMCASACGCWFSRNETWVKLWTAGTE